MPSDPGSDQPARVLLVCHAGASLGIGHLTRSLAVAEALQQVGPCEVRLLIQGEPLVRGDLSDHDHGFISLDDALLDHVDATCASFDPSVIVFDLHPELIPTDFSEHVGVLKRSGVRLVGIDSMLGWCSSLDLTWVPSLLVEGGAVDDCAGDVMWGWDSFLIKKHQRQEAWSRGDRVLILTGGSDVTHQSETLPALLESALADPAQIDWVQGPFADPPVIPPASRHEWTIHVAPAGLTELIEAASYALTVFGVTLFELLQYGVPAVAFSPYDDREFPELDVVAAAGAAVVAANPALAVRELATLMSDEERAREMSTTALELMRVNGAERLAGLIHSLAS